MKMNVYPSLILWVLEYLTNKPQFVILSPTLISNTSKQTLGPTRNSLIPIFFTSFIHQTTNLNMLAVLLTNTQTTLY